MPDESQRDAFVRQAKVIVQDDDKTPLLRGDDDYTGTVFATALAQFSRDVPNKRIVHYTVPANPTGRFLLAGTGAILTDSDAWDPTKSSMSAVWYPWDTSQDQRALTEEDFNVNREPDGVVALELIDGAGAGNVLRLEYTSPHVVNDLAADDDDAVSTIESADENAFVLMLAIIICTLAATRAVQNMGTLSLPGDLVDRRTQADMFARRAKDLRTLYEIEVGIGSADAPVQAASGVAEMRGRPSWPTGFVWSRNRGW